LRTFLPTIIVSAAAMLAARRSPAPPQLDDMSVGRVATSPLAKLELQTPKRPVVATPMETSPTSSSDGDAQREADEHDLVFVDLPAGGTDARGFVHGLPPSLTPPEGVRDVVLMCVGAV
jgi:hypothetical protein